MKVNDLSQVEDDAAPRTLIAPGTYSVIVTDAQERTASTGTEGIGLELEIAEGSDKGRAIWDNVWVTEKAMWRVKALFKALRYEYPEGEFELDPAELIGRRMFVGVDHEEYDGKVRVRVQEMLPNEDWDPANIEPPKPFEKAEDGIPC